MALAYNLGPAKVVGTGTTLTAASATYPANALIVVAVANNFPSSTATDWTIVVSGLSLTWTKKVFLNETNGGNTPGVAIWTATVGSGGSVTGSIVGTSPDTTTGAGHEKFLQVTYYTDTGAPTAGVVGSAFGNPALPTVTLTGLTTGSFLTAINSDWAAAGTSATCTPGNNPPGTPPQTDISDDWTASELGVHHWRTTSAITVASQTMALTAPAAQQYNIAALEIKANPPLASTPARIRMQNRAALVRAGSF